MHHQEFLSEKKGIFIREKKRTDYRAHKKKQKTKTSYFLTRDGVEVSWILQEKLRYEEKINKNYLDFLNRLKM